MASQLYPTNSNRLNEAYPSGPPPHYAYVPVDPFKPSLAFSLNNIFPSRPRRGGGDNEQTFGTTGGELGCLGASSNPFPGNARPSGQIHRTLPPRRPELDPFAPRPMAYRYPQESDNPYNDDVHTYNYPPGSGRVDGRRPLPPSHTRRDQPIVVQPRPHEHVPFIAHQATRTSSTIPGGVPMSADLVDRNPLPTVEASEGPLQYPPGQEPQTPLSSSSTAGKPVMVQQPYQERENVGIQPTPEQIMGFLPESYLSSHHHSESEAFMQPSPAIHRTPSPQPVTTQQPPPWQQTPASTIQQPCQDPPTAPDAQTLLPAAKVDYVANPGSSTSVVQQLQKDKFQLPYFAVLPLSSSGREGRGGQSGQLVDNGPVPGPDGVRRASRPISGGRSATSHDVLQNFFTSLLTARAQPRTRTPCRSRSRNRTRSSHRRHGSSWDRKSSSSPRPIQRSRSESPSIYYRQHRSRSRSLSRRRSQTPSLGHDAGPTTPPSFPMHSQLPPGAIFLPPSRPHSSISSLPVPATHDPLPTGIEYLDLEGSIHSGPKCSTNNTPAVATIPTPGWLYNGPMLSSHHHESHASILESELTPPQEDAAPSTQAYIIAFLFDTVPRQIYLYMLLCLPHLYFSRVTRIFEEAEMSMPMIRQGILDAARAKAEAGMSIGLGAGQWTGNGKDEQAMSHPRLPWAFEFEPPVESAAYTNLQKTWQAFIDSLLREWKTLNIISVLLLSAILSILQLEGAAPDPITRYSALLSMICALMSLLYGCIYIIRFGTMRKTYKGAEWAEEAQKSRTSIWWNIWVLLAMPATWLAWSMIFYIITVMAFVWRTSPFPSSSSQPSNPIPSETSSQILVPRIIISLVLTLGLAYFVLIAATLRKYGEMMDRAWQRRIWGWMRNVPVDVQVREQVGVSGAQTFEEKAIPLQQEKERDMGGKFKTELSSPPNPSFPHRNGRGQNRDEVTHVRGLGKEKGYRVFADVNRDASAFDERPPPPLPSAKTLSPLPPVPSALVNPSTRTSQPQSPPSAPIQPSSQPHFISLIASQGKSHQQTSEPKGKCKVQPNPSTTVVLADATDRDEKERFRGRGTSLKALTTSFGSRTPIAVEVSDCERTLKIWNDPGPSDLRSFESRECPSAITTCEIRMVKLLGLPSAGPSCDALLEQDLTDYGLSLDTLGGEQGKKQWEMFKKQIRAAVSLSSPSSYFTSTPKPEHNSIILIFDKFNAHLRLRGIKGQVALCEEFQVGTRWAGLAVYYFANSGTWPDPYEDSEPLGQKQTTEGNCGRGKKERIRRYQSIPDGLQRLDISIFIPLPGPTWKNDAYHRDGLDLDLERKENPIFPLNADMNNGAAAMPMRMVETRKISLFSGHLDSRPKIQGCR